MRVESNGFRILKSGHGPLQVRLRFFEAVSLFVIVSCVLFSVPVTWAEESGGLQPVEIFFDKGASSISGPAREILQGLAEKWRQRPPSRILIEGYSDETAVRKNAPFKDNQELSQARADGVRNRLSAESGLPLERFESIGRGSRPSDGVGASARRVEILVVFDNQANLEDSDAVGTRGEGLTLSLRDVDLAEAFEMLSKKERVNIVLNKDVQGKVSIHLFDVSLEEAIEAVARAGGAEVLRDEMGYLVRAAPPPLKEKAATEIRTFRLRYADPELVVKSLAEHLSEQGRITVLKDRKLIIVDDENPSLVRIGALIREIDHKPAQVLIEAKILEITLDSSDAFGVDWGKFFKMSGEVARIGTQDLSTGTTGFIATIQNQNLEFFLDALSERGRVRTLSTPRLVTLEDQEASVIVGDRIGYKVTTTINQVTTESIEFLESGVILKVTPSLDGEGRILLRIHPEVSTGTLQDGIPSQVTTEVTTNLLAYDGQPVFIGGLIKDRKGFQKNGVPVVSAIPILGALFSRTEETLVNTETVVLITPHVLSGSLPRVMTDEVEKIEKIEKGSRKNNGIGPE